MHRMILAALFAFALAAPLAACKEKGTMEKAGEKIDEAADEILHPGEGPMEKAGRKIDEAVDDITDGD